MIDLFYKVENYNYGTIEECSVVPEKIDHIVIERETWAPGLWAGIKNQPFAVKNKNSSFYKSYIYVTSVDLQNRTLTIENDLEFPPKLEPGDELFLMIKEENDIINPV